jgi:hypothetical protein
MKSESEFKQSKPSRWALRTCIVLSAALGAMLTLSSIFYIWLYIQQTQNGYHLAKLHEQHEQLLVIQRKLRLEWSRFQDPSQMEELGHKQFGLAPPRQDQKILLR